MPTVRPIVLDANAQLIYPILRLGSSNLMCLEVAHFISEIGGRGT